MSCRLIALLLIFASALAPSAARAEEGTETISICFNYGCAERADATFSRAQLRSLAMWLGNTPDARAERRVLAQVMGKLYQWAGQQTPVSNDRGGNYADGESYGRMDCIDHTETTTRFLKLLFERGLLKFHRVGEGVRRTTAAGFFEHYSATIEEQLAQATELRMSLRLISVEDETVLANPPTGPRFVVDSWFNDNGEPAEIMPLEEWLAGGGPDV